MPLLSPPHQHQPQPEGDDDLALADSFINLDYETDSSPEPDGNRIGSEPLVFGSGGTPVAELKPEPKPEGVNVGALGGAGGGGGIGEGIEIIDLVSDEEELDDEGHESSRSSSATSGSSDGEKEDRDDKSSELEEGEIRVSDADDRSRNVLGVCPPVPPVNVTLEPHHLMLPVGDVSSVIYRQVIVVGTKKHEKPDSLKEGSILWLTESRTPLGLVDMMYGPPGYTFYVVRYNSEDEVPKGIHKGTLISFVPEFANLVLNSNNDLHEKGYDASDKKSSDEMDFSDDDKEADDIDDQNRGKGENNGENFPPNQGVAPTFPVAHASSLCDNGRHDDKEADDIDDQNRGKEENNGENFPPNRGVAPTFPVAHASSLCDNGRHSTFSSNGQGPFGAPAAPMRDHGHRPIFPNNGQVAQGPFGNDHFRAPTVPFHDHGHRFPYSGNGQRPFGAPPVAPPFPHANHGPNYNAGGVLTNGATPWQAQPQPQPQPWFPTNTQVPHQFPVSGPGAPFQQQFNPSQVFPSETMFPRAHPNMYARPMYAQGSGVQNQMPFELHSPFPQVQPPIYAGQQGFPGVQNQMPFQSNSPFSQVQPPIYAGQQGFPSGQRHAETNCNFAPNVVPFNPRAPPQFNPGAWDIHGRRPFH